ncbi:hypothetical protein G6514_006880 [Epicoccum nigrum]|nr:hypothetical protein G6514_006880 [Epicoccum nigrum]
MVDKTGKDFDPSSDIPSLAGKIILITGGTAGLGTESVKALAAHSPSHIYFTGRNASAAESLISSIHSHHPTVPLTFIPLDLSSLASVAHGIETGFKHDRLDILMLNAGIIAKPPSLSPDGYEIQFATNHLGHALVTKKLLPFLLKAAEAPGADVRVISNTSEGYEFHRLIAGGISFAELERGSTMDRALLGPWVRYGQSKLANILYTAELGRRHPHITAVSVHPGVVKTPMLYGLQGHNKWFSSFGMWIKGMVAVEPHEGAWNQLWCAAGAESGELVNGAVYWPVGVDNTDNLGPLGRDRDLAERLWDWTEDVLSKHGN